MHRHKLNITYCHGSENYFLLVNFFSHQNTFKEVDFQSFTTNITAQYPKLKIDGILYLLQDRQADARMRIFNRDGSEAEMCGNGFRCTGKKLFKISGKSPYQIKTLSGIVKGEILPEMFSGIDTYSVEFSKINFDYHTQIFDNQIIPELSNDLKFSSVDVGNPHLIAQVNDFDIDKLTHIGQKINHNCKIFRQGNNLSFYQITGNNQIFVMTYERGVGLTASCGTAMAATGVLAAKNGQVTMRQKIDVYSPGGMLQCYVEKNLNYSVKLSGNATFISRHQIIYDSDTGKIIDFQQLEKFSNEIIHYKLFKKQINLNNVKHTKQ